MDYLVMRSLCSFFCGTILSQTGSLIQLSTRNVLASPSTLGFDGIAVMWVLVFHSLSLYFNTETLGISSLLFTGLIPFIFLGLFFSKLIKGKEKFERLILFGLTFNLLVGTVFYLWQFLFLAFNLPFPVELWFGHFRFVSFPSLAYLILAEAFLLLGLYIKKKDLLLFSLGPGISRHWQLNERSLFQFVFVAVVLGTFIVISLFGAFSFLGLIFPTIARRLWFRRWGLQGEILLGSVLNGIALMGVDLLCYFNPIFGAEIPVGLIVTAVGALSLILLLWKSHNGREILAKTTK